MNVLVAGAHARGGRFGWTRHRALAILRDTAMVFYAIAMPTVAGDRAYRLRAT
jgi:hypothetical protein